MSAGFNFNNIQLSDRADISKVMENFNKIETDGITEETAKEKATTTADGVMSKEDKIKLNGIETGAQVNNITTATLNGVAQTISGGTLSMTETDPTVPAWAKTTNKPNYQWDEIYQKPIFVTQSIVTNFWYGTQSQYDVLEEYDPSTLYLIQEEAD